MTSTDIADRIEHKIDKEVTGGLAVIGSGGAVNIAPRNLGELMEFAKLMALSGPCIRPAFRNNPGACLAISMQAMRWGMDPIAVCNKAYVTKNKAGEEQIGWEAQLVHAVVNERAPLTRRLRARYIGEGSKRRCEILGWLKDEEEALNYQSPEIGDIPVQNSPLWKSDPDQQLFYYSIRAWARRHVPEVLLGVYTVDEIEAQEAHYGPDNAVDVTPPRPKRSDFKPEPPLDIIDSNGEIASFDDPREAGEHLSMLMHEAAQQRSADGAAGIWDSNGLAVTTLRERGLGDLADSLVKEYDELTKPVKSEVKVPGSPAPKKQESLLPPEDKVPGSRLKKKPARTWGDWFLEQLRVLPMEKIPDFIADHSAEYDYMAEAYPDVISEADKIIEARRR